MTNNGKPTVPSTVSGFPDRLLGMTRVLPWPANSGVFNILRRVFEGRGRATGELTRIRFGTVEINAPLDHPAVYWRYRPVGFNQNYLRVVTLSLLARTGLIIDVGANIGDGVALLRGAGLDVPILAIEGADVWFDLLTDNTSALSSVILEKVLLGAGDQEDALALHVHDGTSQLVKAESEVEISSLDRVLSRHSGQPVALLKTDTDGFDLRVLTGAKSLLTTQNPVVFVEVDDGLLREQGNSAEELMAYLAECGYSYFAAWDNWGGWLTARSLSEGIKDLVARYPGGPGTPYMDLAIFSKRDRSIFEAVKKPSSIANGH
ncbi:MAG: FkbM family methyltransferase [Acidobacteriaceae bacterium]